VLGNFSQHPSAEKDRSVGICATTVVPVQRRWVRAILVAVVVSIGAMVTLLMGSFSMVGGCDFAAGRCEPGEMTGMDQAWPVLMLGGVITVFVAALGVVWVRRATRHPDQPADSLS